MERKGESFRVIRVRVVEVAAELDGAIMVIVVVGVGAYQLGEIEARRRTIRFPEFVPVALGGSARRIGLRVASGVFAGGRSGACLVKVAAVARLT